MRKTFLWHLLTITLTLLLISGCAKDQVKPDEGIAGDKAASGEATSGSQTAAQQSASQKTALDQAAALKAAQDAAALKAAQDAAALKAAQDQAAAQKAALEQLSAQQKRDQEAAAQSGASATDALKAIHFDFDSYVLTQQSRDILYSNAEYLLKKYHGKIKLEGHCDERGSDEYNIALGENRAKSALNYLLTLGVPSEQVSIISYGKERPLDNGHTEEAWAKNRRVEFVPVK